MAKPKKQCYGRRVQTYLKPKTFDMFQGYVILEEMNSSEAVDNIMRKFFSSLTPEQQLSYLHKGRSRTSFR